MTTSLTFYWVYWFYSYSERELNELYELFYVNANVRKLTVNLRK